MRITLEQVKRQFPDRPKPAPSELAGQWVAWNSDHTEIVAHGPTFGEVRARAIAAGCRQPLMQRVLGTSFVGGR